MQKDNRWFVLMVSYNRIQKVMKYFKEKDIKYFVPTRYKYIVRQGQRKRIEVPAIHNLMFIHSTPEALKPHLQACSDTIRYMFHRGTKSPVTFLPTK